MDHTSLEEYLAYLSRYAEDVWKKYLEIVGVEKSKAVEAEGDSLRKTASNLKASLDEAVKERDELSRRIGELEGALSEETGKRKGLEAKLQEYEKSMSGLERQVKGLKDELSRSKGDLARLGSEKTMFEGREITMKKVDEYVVASYNEQIERRAQERLKNLTDQVWPAWYEKHHSERVKLEARSMVNELAQKRLWDGMLKALNDVAALKRPFQAVCDKCTTTSNIVISPAGVEALARTGEAEAECPNQSCVDECWFGPFKTGSQRHRFRVPLYDFLRQLPP